MRATRQRAAIIALLDSVEEFRSAQDLHDELRRRGENIGLTTVLSHTAVTVVGRPGWTWCAPIPASRCTGAARHRITTTPRVPALRRHGGGQRPRVEAWAAEVAQAHGFSDVNHTIELFGNCADCRT